MDEPSVCNQAPTTPSVSVTDDGDSQANLSATAAGSSAIGQSTNEAAGSDIPSAVAPVADPFHYLARDTFTSEIFKIEIQNLPKHFGFGQLKKMLHHLNLKPKKLKALNKATYAFVTFSCEEDKEEALRVLNGHTWKGQILKAKLAKPVEDPFTKSLARKRIQDDANENSPAAKKLREEESLPVEERLSRIVTPLWDQPYEAQLKLKQANNVEFLQNLAKQLRKNVQEMSPWVTQQRKTHNGMACALEPIKPSPVHEAYRNKNEFTVGLSVDGKDNTVGFRLGTYKGGQVSVVNPSSCTHICTSTKAIVNAFQLYIREESQLAVYDPQLHTGHWRMLLVRTSQEGRGKMAAIFIHPHSLSQDFLEDEKKKLLHFFKEGGGKTCQLTSLFLNKHGERTMEYEHIDGDKYLMEDLLGLKFRISPEAFFQVNTKAAEVLYTTVGEWAEVTMATTVLDVCCGTGTIGITLAKSVKRVIGIEINQQAIDDAVANATANDLTNIVYKCGKAEDILPEVTTADMKDCDDIVAIVDPPRPGIAPKVLQAIRRCPNLRRLVYVSCHPQNAINNFVDLCRPISNRNKGVPFRPTKAVAIDLFPQTKHCELVILFERADKVDDTYVE